MLSQSFGRLNAEAAAGGSGRGEEAHGCHERRDDGQDDGPLASHEAAFREPVEQDRRRDPYRDPDRELAQCPGEDAAQEAARVRPQEEAPYAWIPRSFVLGAYPY